MPTLTRPKSQTQKFSPPKCNLEEREDLKVLDERDKKGKWLSAHRVKAQLFF